MREKSKTSIKEKNDDAGKLQTEKVMSNAQRIVSSAVNVLEEEIAAGILAAKKLESRIIDVEEVRGNQDELMNRIRRDTHEAVDLFLDAFAALSQQLNTIVAKSKNSVPENSPKKTTKDQETAQTIYLEASKILKPGETAEFQIILCDEEKETKISLTKSDLSSNNNSKISQRNIVIKPASVSLKPKEKAEISITVKIPKTVSSGLYRTILSDKYNPKIIIIISFQIENL